MHNRLKLSCDFNEMDRAVYFHFRDMGVWSFFVNPSPSFATSG